MSFEVQYAAAGLVDIFVAGSTCIQKSNLLSLLFLGDIVAKMIIDRRNLDMKALWQYHANLE